jgi:hypothetical protein
MAEDCVCGVTMCVESVDDLLVVVHTDEPPNRSEWSQYCEVARRHHLDRGGLRTLVIAARIVAGPNASQRTEYNDKVPAKGTRVAVLCNSIAARAAITALSWFNPDMRAFGGHNIDEALMYLSAKPTVALISAIERMQESMHRVPQQRTNARA